MGVPISIRLDEQIRGELESEAQTRGIGLATLLREIATQAALDLRFARMREASARVGGHIASNAEAKEFSDFWGTPGCGLGE